MSQVSKELLRYKHNRVTHLCTTFSGFPFYLEWSPLSNLPSKALDYSASTTFSSLAFYTLAHEQSSKVKFNLHSWASKTFYDLVSVSLPDYHESNLSPSYNSLAVAGALCPFWLPRLCCYFPLELPTLLPSSYVTLWVWIPPLVPSTRDISEPTFLIYKMGLITAPTS